MGEISAPPINEAVNLLHILAPAVLEEYKRTVPSLSSELEPGRIGGISEADSLDLDRARLMANALAAVRDQAARELVAIRARMTSARRHRLWAQIATLICTSGVLASVAIGTTIATAITALLALFSSIGVMLAEHKERLLKQGGSDIFVAYESAGQSMYKAGLAYENLCLLIKHNRAGEELSSAIASANALCEELNKWVLEMSGSDSSELSPLK